MPPSLAALGDYIWQPLIENMIFSMILCQPIRIIQIAAFWRNMIPWPHISFLLSFSLHLFYLKILL